MRDDSHLYRVVSNKNAEGILEKINDIFTLGCCVEKTFVR